MHPISVLIKPASGLCNMRCGYCFYCDIMEQRSQADYGIMSLSTLETVLQKTLATAAGQCTIAYQGGEPTLAGLGFFQRSIELQNKYNINQLQVHNALQTNGLSITEEWATFFKKNNFLVGLSLDGTKKTHDAYRRTTGGGSTFHQVMQTAELFRKHQVDFNILTVVNACTAPAIDSIYAFYKKCGFAYLQFIPCLDPLDGIPGAGEYSLSPAQYGRFLCRLFDLWFQDLQAGRQPYIRMFENYVAMALGMPPESCDMVGNCSLQYVIEANGSVYPCDFYTLDSYHLGNLLQDDFPDLEHRFHQMDFVGASLLTSAECRGCPYFGLCRNGCRRNRQANEAGEPLNRFCESYRIFFAHAGERIAHIAENIRRQ